MLCHKWSLLTYVPPLENGVKSCILARAGYFCPTSGMNTEYACAAGTYTGVTGSTSCSSCPPGYMCPSSALSKPQACSPGRFSVGGNVINCPLCPAGTFNAHQGSTGCCACCAGFFNVCAFHPYQNMPLADYRRYSEPAWKLKLPKVSLRHNCYFAQRLTFFSVAPIKHHILPREPQTKGVVPLPKECINRNPLAT